MKKILIGGSPCTFWSIAQHNNRETAASGIDADMSQVTQEIKTVEFEENRIILY